MDRKEALNAFLRGLQMGLNNAAYFRGHPYFARAVGEFKNKLDALFEYIDPVKITILPQSLAIAGEYFKNSALYIDLARLIHLRKIKSIEFSRGATPEELSGFLNNISLPVREILKSGGIRLMLEKAQSQHIIVEELDYSQFLQDGAEECLDAWAYLLKEAIEKQDAQKINALADNFKGVIAKVQGRDFSDNEELRESLAAFLKYLKGSDNNKFNQCLKDTFASLLKYKDIFNEESALKSGLLFKDLDDSDFASLLWEGISSESNFDALSFKLFCRLSGKKQEENISASLLKGTLSPGPYSINNIRNLLSAPDGSFISGIYRETLSLLMEKTELKAGGHFDRRLLLVNYRSLILNLVALENNRQKLEVIIGRLSQDWDKVFKDCPLDPLRHLWEMAKNKTKEHPALAQVITPINKNICAHIEELVWQGKTEEDLEYFISQMDRPSSSLDFYLRKMFNEGKINSRILRLFFKFFPQDAGVFLDELERKNQDMDFLVNTISGLKTINSPFSLKALVQVYSFANALIKAEVLKAMVSLSEFDKNFIFSVLGNADIKLKSLALGVLQAHPEAKDEAAGKLLAIPNRMGFKNNLILDNLKAVEDASFLEAKEYLIILSRKPFPWNKRVRVKAGDILNRWQYPKQ